MVHRQNLWLLFLLVAFFQLPITATATEAAVQENYLSLANEGTF
jgi:hypothetical protein